jgi:hypothetical protein
MPYQDSSLATRLKEAPKGHRGYATPGVKYGKGGTPKPKHRPAVVSDRDIDRRIGKENGQARGDKYPYRDNEVPSGLSKKYKPFATKMRDERMRKLLNAKREMVNRADNVDLSSLGKIFEFGRKKEIAKFADMARRKGVDGDMVRIVPDRAFPKKKGWKKKKHIKKFRKMTNKTYEEGFPLNSGLRG